MKAFKEISFHPVVPLHVNGQRSLLAELLGAHAALKIFHVLVDFLMVPPCLCIPKSGVTGSTLEPAFQRMSVDVNLQGIC